MAQRIDANKKRFNFANLGRPERYRFFALAIVFASTCIGLAFLLTEFLDSTTKTAKEFSASIARDTLALTGYDRSIQLFYLAQEAFVDPSKKVLLYPRFRALAEAVDSVSAAYRSLLAESPGGLGESLRARWGELSGAFDRLIGTSEQVFIRSTRSSTRPGPRARSRRALSNTPSQPSAETFLPNANEFFGTMRLHLDRVLREELAEDIVQVQASQDETGKIAYRGFFVAFFLIGVGVVLAVALTRRGRQFEERRRRYETLLEQSINPIQVVDNEGRTRYVNPAYERWVGSQGSEDLDRPAFEGVIVPRGSGTADGNFWDSIVDTLKQGQAWSGEVEFRRKGQANAYTWLMVSPVVGGGGDLLECVTIYHDVTDRRELAQKFAESQEKYRSIVESSLDGIVLIQDGKLVFANPSAVRIFGFDSVEEMTTTSFSDTIAPSSRAFILGERQTQMTGEEILKNDELKGLTKNGKIIDLEVNARLVPWNGRSAVQASFRDITARKQLERELALWLWEQETLSAIDRQLVSTVELQTVLNTICFQAKTLTRADWTGVMMVDLPLNLVRWRAAKGNRLPLQDEAFRPSGVLLSVIQKNEPTVLHGFGTNPDLPVEDFPPFKDEEIVSIARFPLNVELRIRGQLVIGYRDHHEFSAREIRLLNSLAEKSSIALTNAELYDNLVERERELELLSGARVKAQEEERRRIAREIHDSLGQMLTAIKFNVEILEDAANVQGEEDHRRIEDIKGLLDNAMSEAREISHNLMPSVLVDFGLVPALQLLCDQFSKRNNLAVNVHTQGVGGRLDSGIEVGLYRIAQEALNNIAKHAAAREVNVQLIGDSASLRLVIDDDGRGFRAERFDRRIGKERGMGLVSMRERAASFSGTFTLDSSPGRGTEIIVEVPLKTPHADGQDPDSSR
jgi:PAS domain S-box-containing protein